MNYTTFSCYYTYTDNLYHDLLLKCYYEAQHYYYLLCSNGNLHHCGFIASSANIELQHYDIICLVHEKNSNHSFILFTTWLLIIIIIVVINNAINKI